MGAIRNLIRNVFVLAILGGIASAVAAAFAKNRMLPRGESGDDDVELVAIYDSLDFSSSASALKQATITTWYGGGTVDLRSANLDPAGATLTIRALFGGLRLVIPETWRVDLRAKAVFGGVTDIRETASVGPEGPTLTIEGFAVFGGIAILSEAPDLATSESFSAAATESSEATEPVTVPA